MGYYKTHRNYQQARWDEPIILELGNPGERGILVPQAAAKVVRKVGAAEKLLPAGLRRKHAPQLPEMSQMQVLRHYMRPVPGNHRHGYQYRYRPGYLYHEVQPQD
jgi:glycine dehydrogenase subunit 2